jgi:hypothetical protein
LQKRKFAREAIGVGRKRFYTGWTENWRDLDKFRKKDYIFEKHSETNPSGHSELFVIS